MKKALAGSLCKVGWLMCLVVGCAPTSEAPPLATTETALASVGGIERLASELDALLPADATLEVLAEGFNWSEGPVWVPSNEGGFLLFSDVPENVIYRWSEALGSGVWLQPSGFTGTPPRGAELGSNGLALAADGALYLAQHGDRRLARLAGPLEPGSGGDAAFATVADRFGGQRFSSPNDLILGEDFIVFTDPPYGLENGPDDPAREIDFNGVYAVDSTGEVSLVTDALARPNGVALSPNGDALYITNSDPENAVWWRVPRSEDGGFRVAAGDEPIFFDATSRVGEFPGLPDGLDVDTEGNVWSTGPGGVLVLSPDGRHLGTLLTERPTGNCTFGEDGALYITADDLLLRVRTSATGVRFARR